MNDWVEAEKLGLPTSPPYLSLVSKFHNKKNVSFLDGVSFASGGAGIFDGTNESLVSPVPILSFLSSIMFLLLFILFICRNILNSGQTNLEAELPKLWSDYVFGLTFF